MPDSIQTILEEFQTLAVVGLSSKPMRPSHGVSSYLMSHGYHIIPVNPHEESVLGEKAYASLEDVPEAFDVVVIFRRSEYVPEVVDEAIHKGAKVIWMQEGVENEEARPARASSRAPGHPGPLHLERTRQTLCLRRHLKAAVALQRWLSRYFPIFISLRRGPAKPREWFSAGFSGQGRPTSCQCIRDRVPSSAEN